MWDLLSLGEANIISSLKSYDINIGATKHTGILINSQEHDRVSHSLSGEAAWGPALVLIVLIFLIISLKTL